MEKKLEPKEKKSLELKKEPKQETKAAPIPAPKKRIYETKMYVEGYCTSSGKKLNVSSGFIATNKGKGPFTATEWQKQWDAFMKKGVK